MTSSVPHHETRPDPVEPTPDRDPPPSPAQEGPADPVETRSGIEGYIDIIDGDRIVGWAYDPHSPGRRLLIEISAGSTVEVVLSNLERHDLRDAGKGDGRHGFEAKLDLAATGAEVVHVKVVATGQDLGGSPARTGLVQLVAAADRGRVLECLKSEAQLALLSLTGVKTR